MKVTFPLFIFSSLLLLFSGNSLAKESSKLKVVTSIAPIHSLVAGVMEGVSSPELLVKGGGSPHDYSLRPSEARMLAQADLVIWVGPSLEGFLEKPLRNLAQKARQLELMKALEDRLLPMREGGSWEAHAGHEEKEDSHGHHAHDHHGDHDEGESNPHLWLNPLLAKTIVSETATTLKEIDPDHAAIYHQNETRLHTRLDSLHKQLSAKLAPVKNIPYIVFHDAYPYFEAAYGLKPVGSITVDPERQPGAKRISEIRDKIKTLNARCVFSEPQFEPRLVDIIIEGTGARKGVLDPLGASLHSDPESYFQLMHALADNLLAGLR